LDVSGVSNALAGELAAGVGEESVDAAPFEDKFCRHPTQPIIRPTFHKAYLHYMTPWSWSDSASRTKKLSLCLGLESR